jgi:hypothetical protein
MLIKPVGIPMFVVACLISLLLLLWGLYPGFYYIANFIILLLLWWFVGLIYLLRSAIRCWLLARNQQSEPNIRKGRHWGVYIFLVIFITTLILGFKIPLKVGFLTARSELEELSSELLPVDSKPLKEDQRIGLYNFSAKYSRRGSNSKERLLFVLSDDSEAAFIYSTNGIENLGYNCGDKGHLFGNWYWMKED